jgi:hypothetical protein
MPLCGGILNSSLRILNSSLTIGEDGRRVWRAPARALVEMRELPIGSLQDRDVGIGVFPEGEEILIRSGAD